MDDESNSNGEGDDDHSYTIEGNSESTSHVNVRNRKKGLGRVARQKADPTPVRSKIEERKINLRQR